MLKRLPLVCLLLLMLGAPASAQETEAPAAPAPEPEAPQEDLTTRTRTSLEALDQIQTELEPLGRVDNQREATGVLEEEVAQIIPEGFDPSDESVDYVTLDQIVSQTRGVVQRLDRITGALSDQSAGLEALVVRLDEVSAGWTAEALPEDIPPALTERIDGIVTLTDELRVAANDKLNDVVDLQNRVLELTDRIGAIERQVRTADADLQRRIFVANAPPLWALSVQSVSASSTSSPGALLIKTQQDFERLLTQHPAAFGFHMLSLPLLLLGMLRLKRSAPDDSSALNRPLAMGLLIWLLLGLLLYMDAPLMVRIFLNIAIALTAVTVLLAFLAEHLHRGVIVLAGLYLLERLVFPMATAEPAPRLAYLVVAFGMFTHAFLATRRVTLNALVELGLARGVILAGAIAALTLSAFGAVLNVLGYAQFGKLFVGGVVRSTTLFLILFASIRVIRDVISIALELPSLSRVRSVVRNRRRLEAWFQKPLVLLALVLWAWGTLIMFSISDEVLGVLGAMLGAELSVGQITLSLSGVLSFALAVWLAVVTSRIVRSILDDDVLPRMRLPRGVPHTISTTANYTIVIIGVLLGVAFLGIDLSSLAFIVGALGVGIGFGLQNLVNNFVSGLILIFERPIQVGDTVEVGNLLGRVTHIGIRTSRVRTYSGSEVIVPNGDLASNQVINWTLSDRRRRLEFEVGVAYGTDPDVVTALLHKVAEEDEGLLADPAPIVVFEAFGDSSLNFRLYAWISDYDVGFSSRHRVTTAINTALAQAGVEIPFPQRDLHVKTLPEGAQALGSGA